MPITFSVSGEPIPQPRPRVTTRGGFGRAYVPHDHAIHAYRGMIAAEAKKAGATPTDKAPLTVIIDFVFSRPKSHFRKSGLRDDAPRLPRADCTNLAKGVEDALNGVAWVDDTQVGKLIIEKSYGTEARTTVRIT